jgi:hypothetical protein
MTHFMTYERSPARGGGSVLVCSAARWSLLGVLSRLMVPPYPRVRCCMPGDYRKTFGFAPFAIRAALAQSLLVGQVGLVERLG